MEKAGVALEREVPPQLWTVTDYIACDQVLTNLIQNAVFHTTPPCKMRVRAFCRAAPELEQAQTAQTAEGVYTAILSAIQNGELTEERIDESVTRILCAKLQLQVIE